MSEQDQNIEAIQRGFDAYNRGDVETVLSLYADDVEWITPGQSAISGTYHGKGQLSELMTRLGEKTSALRLLHMVADGDTVIVFSEATIDAQTSQDVEVFTLRDGKVARVQTYGDTALMERIYGKKQLASG